MRVRRRRESLLVSSAILAAVELGQKWGVETSAPVVLQETNNTVIWLAPGPVIAKVATRTDAKTDVRLEHAVAKELTALEADTTVPLPGTEPVEHPGTGFVVTLWEQLQGRDAEVPAYVLSDSLAALHAALAKTRTQLPSFRSELLRARVALDNDVFMDALPYRDRVFLRSVYDEGLSELEGLDLDRQRLHGEPHSGNRLLTPQGLRWIDFESCCVGPLEWDLAFLSPEARRGFPDIDTDLLRRLGRLNSARVATWCWGRTRYPEMRRHGELHLGLLRAEADGA